MSVVAYYTAKEETIQKKMRQLNHFWGIYIASMFSNPKKRVYNLFACRSLMKKSDHTLVRNGTKCSESSICISGKCTSLNKLPILPCPTSLSGKICSGRGRCTNRGNCFCYIGFTGKSCEFIGPTHKIPADGTYVINNLPPTTHADDLLHSAKG